MRDFLVSIVLVGVPVAVAPMLLDKFFIPKRHIHQLLDELTDEYDARLTEVHDNLYFYVFGQAKAVRRIRERLGLER